MEARDEADEPDAGERDEQRAAARHDVRDRERQRRVARRVPSAVYTTACQPAAPTAPNSVIAVSTTSVAIASEEPARQIALRILRLLGDVRDALDREVEPDRERQRRERTAPAVRQRIRENLAHEKCGSTTTPNTHSSITATTVSTSSKLADSFTPTMLIGVNTTYASDRDAEHRHARAPG